MDASNTPVTPPEARPAALVVAKPKTTAPAQPSPVQKAAQALEAERRAEAQTKLEAGKLMVQIDAAAGRFVNILADVNTGQVVRQYPNDAQLAFSRAIRAYVRRMSDN